MNYKVIIKPSIARQLLHNGNSIVDIKPNKLKSNIEEILYNELNKYEII